MKSLFLIEQLINEGHSEEDFLIASNQIVWLLQEKSEIRLIEREILREKLKELKFKTNIENGDLIIKTAA